MPHSPEEKKRVNSRLKRIRGQADSLIQKIEDGSSCGDVLQQLAAMRGAINGLMGAVLEGHLRESFGHIDCDINELDSEHQQIHAAIDETLRLVRSYLK